MRCPSCYVRKRCCTCETAAGLFCERLCRADPSCGQTFQQSLWSLEAVRDLYSHSVLSWCWQQHQCKRSVRSVRRASLPAARRIFSSSLLVLKLQTRNNCGTVRMLCSLCRLPACCTCVNLSKLISARLIADVQRHSSQLKNRF